MRLFAEELRKLARPGLLAVLALVGAAYFFILPSFYVEPDYVNHGNGIESGRLLNARYGSTLEDDEFEDLTRTLLPEIRTQLDTRLAEIPLAAQYGLAHYDDFERFWFDTVQNSVSENREMSSEYEDCMRIITALNAADSLHDSYEQLLTLCDNFESYERPREQDPRLIDASGLTPRELDFEKSVRYGPKQAWRGILPSRVVYYTLPYAEEGVMWVVLSVLLLVSTPLVGDRLARMRALQWSSRQGRRILVTQFGAAMLSAFLWIALNTAVYLAVFSRNNFGVFAAAPMSASLSGLSFAGDMNYGQWCMLLVGMAFFLGLGAAALGFFVARYSGDYVSMLLKLAPLAAAVGFFTDHVFNHTASYFCSDLPLIVLFFAAALGLCMAACLRQRRKELLSA